MNTLEKILKVNKHFIQNLPKEYITCTDCELPADISKYPDKQLAIYSCMDTRLVDFLEPAMGIERGEAKVIKAAGNTITSTFDNIIRSFLVAIYELGVQEIIVVGHEDCGMSHSTSEGLIEKMLARGIHPSAIKLIEDDLVHWLDRFHEPVQNIHLTVAAIRTNPLIPTDVPVHGLLFSPHTGAIDVIIDGYKEVAKANTTIK